MVRVLLALAVASASVSSVLAQSPDSERALALIDKALKAGGGAAKIAQFKALTARATVKMSAAGKQAKVDADFAGFDQMRLTFHGKKGDADHKAVMVVNGGRGWIKVDDEAAEEFPSAHLTGIKDMLHAMCLPDLLLTLKSRDYTLHPLDGYKVDGKDVAGIRVTHADQKEVRLFFDPSSSLVVKSMVKLNSKTDTEQWCECYFTNCKAIAGVHHFTHLRIRQGGKDILAADIQELHLLTKVNPEIFAKP
jgi:hypothetical protein